MRTTIVPLSATATMTERPLPEATPPPGHAFLDWLVGAASSNGRGGNAGSGEPDIGAAGGGRRLEAFLDEPDLAAALALWLGDVSPILAGPPAGRNAASQRRVISLRLTRDIAEIDRLLNDQLNAILHHPQFQRIEASWNGLNYLVKQTDPEDNIKIKVLSVSWPELARDAERAVEFDQSQLFRKVYSEQIGSPGGEPFGLLVGDYEITHRPSAAHPIDDPSVLASVAQTAAAAFAPFVASADPALLGLESFVQLERAPNLGSILTQPEYVKWRAFREHPDSRFIGLALPRVLMRLPYMDHAGRPDGFCFHEDVAGPDRSKYLWGNAAYAFASTLIRAFAQSHWLADIRGVRRGEIAGGLVAGLPVHGFATDALGVAIKSSLEIQLGDVQEKDLSDMGLIPLCACKDTEFSVFYANPSVQQPRVFDRAVATANARMSASLQYIFCASRFAHYLKILMRDKLGSFTEASQIEDFLSTWVRKYVAPDASASPAVKAKYPLHGAEVQVRDRPGMPGSYLCILHLLPHFQLDAIAAGVRLTTELVTTGT